MFGREISSGGLVETENVKAPQALNLTEQVQQSSGFPTSVRSENNSSENRQLKCSWNWFAG